MLYAQIDIEPEDFAMIFGEPPAIDLSEVDDDMRAAIRDFLAEQDQ